MTGFFGHELRLAGRAHRLAGRAFLGLGVALPIVTLARAAVLLFVQRRRGYLVLSDGSSAALWPSIYRKSSSVDTEPGELPETMAAWVIREER